MAFVVKDRVKQSTTTTGTGSIVLNGTVSGFQTFANALSDGDTTYYAIFEVSTNEWEVGVGTWTESTTTLARTTVLASSNSNSAIDLSAQAEVFITQPAGKAAFFDPSGDLTLVQDPTSNLQAATKQYVDTIAAAGLHYHDPVRVEQEGNLSATYSNGTAGVGATLTNNSTQAALTIDGVALSLNDRVLIYEQTNGYENGVYTVTNVGSASTNWVLTRATDADSYAPSDPDSLGQGDAFFVLEGTAGAGELYVMNTEGTITFGTTNITFTQVAATAVYTAGTGLTLTGTEFAADGANITNVDAVTLDGIDSSQFLRSDVVDTKTAGNLNFSDNVKAQFGDSSDLQIYHDGNSWIKDLGAGNLILSTDGNGMFFKHDNDVLFEGYADGAVNLYYDNAQKLATTSTGVDITGTLTSDGLTVEGSDFILGTFERTAVGGGVAIELKNGDNNSWEVTNGGDEVYSLRYVPSGGSAVKYFTASSGGDISFYDTSGNAKFFWDASTMALGIGTGTTTPINPITIQQTSVHWPYIALTNTSGTVKSQFGYQVNDDLLDIVANSGGIKFRTNNTETMRLTSAGNLGIGTTSPTNILHVSSSVAQVKIENTGADEAHIELKNASGSAFVGAVGAANELLTGTAAGDMVIGNRMGGKLILSADSNNAQHHISITEPGYVGIGISSPTQELHVHTTSSGNADIRLTGYNQTSTYMDVYSGTTSSGLWVTGSSDMRLGTNGTARLTIDTSGNVGIGTSSPSSKLHVSGGSGARADVQVTYDALGTASGDGAQFGIQSAGAYVWNFENSDTYFAANNTRSLTLKSGGWAEFERSGKTLYVNANYSALNTFAQIATPASGGMDLSLAAQDTREEDIYIKSSTGYVGMGTTSPAAKLHITPTDFTAPSLIIDSPSSYSEGDMYVLHGRDVGTGIGFSSTAFGVNVQSQIPTDNIPQLRSNTGGLTSAGLMYVGADEVSQGVFGVMGASGSAGTDLAHLFTVRSSGNVGIGTTSPAAKLDVTNSSASHLLAIFDQDNTSYNTDISIKHASRSSDNTLITKRIDGDLWFYQSNDTDLEFFTNGSQRLIINGSGNVGINNGSPQNTLTINTPQRTDGGTNSLGQLVVAGPISDSPSHDFTNGGTAIFRIQGTNATNNLQFGVGSSGYSYHPWIQGSYDNTSNNGPKAIILQPLGGNVGINTTNPQYQLHVDHGSATYSSFLDGDVILRSNGPGSWNDGLNILDNNANGWAGITFHRGGSINGATTNKYWTGLRSGTNNYIMFGAPFSGIQSASNISAPRDDIIFEHKAGTTGYPFEFYVPVNFGQEVGIGTTSTTNSGLRVAKGTIDGTSDPDLVLHFQMDVADTTVPNKGIGDTTGTRFGTYTNVDAPGGQGMDTGGNLTGIDLGAAPIDGISNGDDFTISFFCKLDATFTNSYVGLFTSWSTPNNFWFGLRNVGGQYGFHTNQNNGSQYIDLTASTIDPGIGSWHHWCLVKKGTTFYAYFDGQLHASGTGTGSVTGWYDGTSTGSTGTGQGTFYHTINVTNYTTSYATDHALSDFRLYKRGLNAYEIAEIYKMTGRHAAPVEPQTGNITLPAVKVKSSAANVPAIAIQQVQTEGDTIIFADFEPYVEYNIMADNSADTILFNSGTSTGSLGSRTVYNGQGTARTAYTKLSVELNTGNLKVGGKLYNDVGSDGLQLGHFTSSNTDQWPLVTWLRDTANGYDEGLIHGASNRGVFGRSHFGIHFDDSRSFAFHTSSWDTEMEINGDGTIYMKGPVGIGTASPSEKLHVVGNIHVEGNIERNGSTTDTLTIAQNASTTDPAITLWGRDNGSYPGQVHIVGRNSNASASSGDIQMWNYNGSSWFNMFNFSYDTDNSDTRATIETGTDVNTAIMSKQSMYFIIDAENDQNDRGFFFGHNADRPGAATQLMTIKESGKVGIGTTSPQEELHVNGDIYVAENNGIIRPAETTKYANFPSGLVYRYYNNPTASVHPLNRFDLTNRIKNSSSLLEWGITSTVNGFTKNSDYYQVEFHGYYWAPTEGLYEFGIDSDDASDFFIDGVRVADFYQGHGVTGTYSGGTYAYQNSGQAYLQAGWHRLYARFSENSGGDECTLWHKEPSGSFEIIPADHLYHSAEDLIRASTGTFQIYGTTQIHDGSLQEEFRALSGTSVTCDPDTAGAFALIMSGNTTFTFGGTSSGWSSSFVLQLVGNASTAYTVTWPSSVVWSGGTAPDAPGTGELDMYVFYTRDGGTTWYGAQSHDAAA